jgi:hypothetical protein
MADDKISKRLDALEEETESQVRDLIITCVTEQHVRVGDELVVVKREPSGYRKMVVASEFGTHGISTRATIRATGTRIFRKPSAQMPENQTRTTASCSIQK